MAEGLPQILAFHGQPGTEYVIDDDTLARRALNPPAMRQQANAVLARRQGDAAALARAQSQAGLMLVYAGDVERGEACLRSAMEALAHLSDARGHCAAAIRWTQALEARGLWLASIAALEEQEARIRQHAGLQGLLDFVLQHLGKACLGAGRLDAAERALNEALALREAAGNAELIESSRQALAALARRRAATAA
ncbi:hypothetical protein [Chromobacterium sp. IIBBL 290-4]|uniref:hypothetical protein n=1 Tax=Chromobacterium sp. IIBBL 290-4 TaxID=2953890 RepID=UPI0020B67FFC|nr:hypothetical protein [Chromobacterium sp. IIBBL 290-4]UTH74523.1 hypothetical protein NKT35_23850 [Chromobacterium sp. IIBBL 290-4]